MFFHQGLWVRAVVAELIGITAIVLGRFIVEDASLAAEMSRGLTTPLTWPKLMLAGVGLCAVGWAVEEGWKAFHALPPPPSAAEEAVEFGDVGFEEEAAVPFLPVALGLALAIAYAFLIPTLGFTVATVAFLVLWFAIGGIRKPLQLAAVSIVGTIVVLFVFVKLALMPLDRGVGAFGDFTIMLFRLLGIY